MGSFTSSKLDLGLSAHFWCALPGRPRLWLSATPPPLWILFDNINISVYFTQWCGACSCCGGGGIGVLG